MSVYFTGLTACFLTEPYKAAYNACLAETTSALVQEDTRNISRSKLAQLLRTKDGTEDGLPHMYVSCLLAEIFAEQGIFAQLRRTDGTISALCWYRIADIPKACAEITPHDSAAVQEWVRRVAGGPVVKMNQ
jgi:hypothetical protein